jgi:threonine dehydrogenase-like Zn-dependent dehydrogenase
MPATMRAVVLKEPYKLVVEDVPVPTIVDETDLIMKVHMAGLCGERLALVSYRFCLCFLVLMHI